LLFFAEEQEWLALRMLVRFSSKVIDLAAAEPVADFG
jgi:hypothetical protein